MKSNDVINTELYIDRIYRQLFIFLHGVLTNRRVCSLVKWLLLSKYSAKNKAKVLRVIVFGLIKSN